VVLGPVPTAAATSDNGPVDDETRGNTPPFGAPGTRAAPGARPGEIRDAVELLRWARPRLVAAGRGLATAVLSYAAGTALLVLSIVALALLPVGWGCSCCRR
jgi:hypothetical protein